MTEATAMGISSGPMGMSFEAYPAQSLAPLYFMSLPRCYDTGLVPATPHGTQEFTP
jgi:hypothetical protein